MVKLNIDMEQLKNVIKQLPSKQRAKLIGEFQRDLRKVQYDELLKSVRKKMANASVTSKDIDRELKIVQREIYDSSRS